MFATLTPVTTFSGQQVLILKEGSTQTKGRAAQRNNIFAAKLISEIVKSSLGPKGMDKMLVDSLGDVTIIDKEVVHPGMPKRVEEAKIALVISPLEIEKTEFSAEIRINDPSQMKKFMEEENSMLAAMVDKISSWANEEMNPNQVYRLQASTPRLV